MGVFCDIFHWGASTKQYNLILWRRDGGEMGGRTTGCNAGPRAAPGQTWPYPCTAEPGLPLAGDLPQSAASWNPGADPRGCRWRPVAQCAPRCTGRDTGSSSKADVSCAAEASLLWVPNPAEHLPRVWSFALCTRQVQGSTRTHVWGVHLHRASSLRMTHVAFWFWGSVCERQVKISSGGFTVINLVSLKGSACGTECYY